MVAIKIADFFVERYRVLTNYVGTVILAWLLSGLAAQSVALLLPNPTSLAPNAFTDSNENVPSLMGDFSQSRVSDYMAICERNIFDSQKRTSCTEEVAMSLENVEVEPALDLNSPPVKSDLAAKLLGTMVFSDSKKSFATISPSSGKDSKTYRLGDEFMGEAKIYEIARNQVFFVRNGRREYIEVDKLPLFSRAPKASSAPSAQGIRKDGNKITMSKAKVDATLQDLNSVIQQSRMVPNYENGKVTGFKIFAIRRGSIFEQLGLKNGDVIQRINGTTIDSIEKALPMLEIVKTESNVKIDMVRGGSKQTLDIDIQ